MFKMITLVPRKPGMSREAFIAHYEEVHVPLIMALFPRIVKNVRNYPSGDNFHYVSAPTLPRVPFDAVTEHWFEDRACYDATMAAFAEDPEKFKLLSEDEEKFCDQSGMIMFLVDEHETSAG